MKLSELVKEDKLKALIFGDAGAGKTTFSVSLPGPVLVLDFDKKITSAANYWADKKPEIIENTEVKQFPMNKVNQDPYLKFRAIMDECDKQVAEGKFKYNTVVLDSLTIYSEALMNHVIKTNPGIKRAIKDVASLQDYLVAANLFKQDMGRFLDLPANCIAIGHVKRIQNEETMEVKNQVLLSGSLANYAPKVFREVWYASSSVEKDGKPIHKFLTRNNGKYECRTDIQKLPSIVQMDWETISKYIGEQK